MRTNLKKTTIGYVAITFLAACPLISFETTAMPSETVCASQQVVASATIIDTQARPATIDKTPTLARNTSTKGEGTTAAAAPKGKNIEEKKTISRCWKRLMNMAREIRHAHSKTNK